MVEDRHLLELVRSGEVEGLRQIYEKYKDELLTISTSILSDIYAPEDCLHDVFVNFVSSGCSSRIRNLRSYLIKSVVNQARDRLKKRKKQVNCPVEDVDCCLNLSDPAWQITESEESNSVFEALAKLPDEQRETIVLHIHGEMKFKEIAHIQGVSINTVQSRYSYGIEKLRVFLGKGKPI